MNRTIQRRDRGYTLSELFFVVWMLLGVGVAVGSVWTAVHFICKYW